MKLFISLALALGLATINPVAMPEADACGFYGPTAEDRVRWAFASEFEDHVYKTIHEIRFIDDDTVRVELRWAEKEDRAVAQYAWLTLRDGRWKRSGLSYTTTVWLTPKASKPAVAAR